MYYDVIVMQPTRNERRWQEFKAGVKFIVVWGTVIGLIVTLSALICLHLISQDLDRELEQRQQLESAVLTAMQ